MTLIPLISYSFKPAHFSSRFTSLVMVSFSSLDSLHLFVYFYSPHIFRCLERLSYAESSESLLSLTPVINQQVSFTRALPVRASNHHSPRPVDDF
jgi:hypothetical protein